MGDLRERAVVVSLQRGRGDAEPQPARTREVVPSERVVVVDRASHVWIAAVELERDLLLGPRGVGDVTVTVDEELVLESRFGQSKLLGPPSNERLPLVS